MAVDVEISEVGPRDGLQILGRFVPTGIKTAWITAEAAAGVREIEVCSFVPPKVVPQFTDAEAVVAHALTIDGLTVAALVPNLKGAERAVAAGVHKITFTISVSQSHSQANVRRTPDQQVEEFRRIVQWRAAQPEGRRPILSAGLGTVFGCVYEGPVAVAEVCRLAVALAEAGASDISLADTAGYADPAQVRRVVPAVRQEIGVLLSALHLHDTRGLALANVLAGLDLGVRGFDGSLGGLGGCPFAPGAAGNVATEDLAYLIEAMGLRTGIDLEKLIEARRALERTLPDETLRGHLARAGLPRKPGSAAATGEAAP